MRRIYSTSLISGLQIATLVVMILNIICGVIWTFYAPSFYKEYLPYIYYSNSILQTPLAYILPFFSLLYTIPMTVSYYRKIKDGIEPVGCGFIVCTFIFFSPIAAILMLIDR